MSRNNNNNNNNNNSDKVLEVINSTINDFNSVLQDFVQVLATITPKSTLSNNQDIALKIMKTPRFRTVFINKFVKHIMSYKTNFDNNDDAFFLNDDFTKKVLDSSVFKDNLRELDKADLGVDKIKVTENTIMDKIFEFKKFWRTFDDETKKTCFSYMQTLCALSEDYFLLEDSLLPNNTKTNKSA